MQVRSQLKDKNFMTSLTNFDIRTVTKNDINLVKRILDDPWMENAMRTRHLGIAAESYFCLGLWKWCRKINEFVEVSQRLESFGISFVED